MKRSSENKMCCPSRENVNYKWMACLVISVWLMAMVSGCASITKVFNHEPHDIAKSDANKVYPAAILTDHHNKLTKKQSRLINELYGDEISQEGDLIAYYNARKRLPTHYRAKVFLVHAKGESSQLDVIVGMRGSVVDRIAVKDNFNGEGKSVIPDEFIRQFIGRTLHDSWQVAEDPKDLVGLPSMILPVAGHQRTSKDIASNIRKVLVWVTALELYYS